MREVARSHPTCLTFLELCDPKDRSSNKSPAAVWFKTGTVGKLVLSKTEVGKFWIRVGYPIYRSVISTLRLFLFSLALSIRERVPLAATKLRRLSFIYLFGYTLI